MNEVKETQAVEKLNTETVKSWFSGEVEVRLPKWFLVIGAVASLALVVLALD